MADTTTTQQPAPTTSMRNNAEYPNVEWLAFGLVAVVAGLIIGGYLVPDHPRLVIAKGMSVFAVIYILTQGVERVNEFFVAVLAWVPKSPENTKRAQLAQGSDPTGKDTKVTQARSDLTVLTLGFSFALSYCVVSYFGYGLLATISTTESYDVSPTFDRLFTALIVAGGSKGLHDLISKIQKSKESSDT